MLFNYRLARWFASILSFVHIRKEIDLVSGREIPCERGCKEFVLIWSKRCPAISAHSKTSCNFKVVPWRRPLEVSKEQWLSFTLQFLIFSFRETRLRRMNEYWLMWKGALNMPFLINGKFVCFPRKKAINDSKSPFVGFSINVKQ